MLDLIDIHTYYGDSHVLQGTTLRAERGQVTAVLGRNGVGKTTLCRSLAGLTPARHGRVVLDGADLTRLPPHRISEAGISLVPQGRRIFVSLTVHENLLVAARGARTGSGWNVDRVFAVFPRLAERRHHAGNDLSGGEQQMLAIARALVANPTVLVMDEPTEGLAPALVAEVARLIRQLREEGTTILLVEQNAAFAVDVADAVHVMHQGAIVHSSAPAALWENEEIKSQYLGVPGNEVITNRGDTETRRVPCRNAFLRETLDPRFMTRVTRATRGYGRTGTESQTPERKNGACDFCPVRFHRPAEGRRHPCHRPPRFRASAVRNQITSSTQARPASRTFAASMLTFGCTSVSSTTSRPSSQVSVHLNGILTPATSR